MHPTDRLPEILDRVDGEGLESRLLQPDELKRLAAELDADLRKRTSLPTFVEYVRTSELTVVKDLLGFMNARGSLGTVDTRPEALRALLDRGKATKMAVLTSLGYTYRRAKRLFEDNELTVATAWCASR